MKTYIIFSLLIALTMGEAYAARGRTGSVSRVRATSQRRPQTTAEQLMRNYTPQPYPSGRMSHPRRFNQAVAYPSYRGYVSYSDEGYGYPEATNESEHLGIGYEGGE